MSVLSVQGEQSSSAEIDTLNNLASLAGGTGLFIRKTGATTFENASEVGMGTVTKVSVVSANGLAGTVATDTTTPAITISTSITGLLKGNGTAISAASDGTDFLSSTTGLKLDQTTPQTVTSGNPRFNEGILGGTDANKTDFPKATAVFSAGDSGHTYAEKIAIVGEAKGESGVQGIGVGGVSTTNGYFPGIGVFGRGLATSTDAGGSIGVQGEAVSTHANGSNVAFKADAQNGATNYSFYGANGVLYNDDPIQLGLTPTVGTHGTGGKLYWDTTWKTGTLELEDDVNLQIGQETVAYVYNGTGSTITQGKVVYTSSTQAGIPSISLAQGDTDTTSQVLGVVTSTSIADAEYGYVTIRGHVNNINTSAWSLNDNLYLDAATAGALTNVKPNTGDYDTRIGRVMLVDASTGRVYVNIVREYKVGAVSAGAGVEMFPDDTTITAAGTQSTYPIKVLSKTPVSTAEDVDTITMNNSTVLYGTYLNTAPIGLTSIAGGVWQFDIWAGVSSATNTTSLTQNVNRVRPGVGTLTTTDLTATSKTATASTGTPFAAANVDVGGTIDTDSFLQTPQGYYRILTRVSDTVVTIEVPATYTNEAGVVYSTHKKLFGITTGEINNVATSPLFAGLQLYTVTSVQGAFTVEATDTLASTFFGVSTGARSVYFSHNGTTRYSHFTTPLITRHNDLAGLDGGTAGEYYHLTSAQHTIATQSATTDRSGYLTDTDWDTFNGKANANQTFYIGTTQVAINRASAALTLAGITLTTPDIGTPSAGVLTNCSGYPINIVDDTTPELGGEMDAGAHSIGFTQQTATGDGTTTIDWKLGNKFYFTFGNASETFTFTAPSNPCNLVLVLKQYSTGGKTATWPNTVMWPGGTAPTLSTGNNAIDIISFYYDGTNYYGVSSLNFSVPA